MNEQDAPALITQSEFMRRMKEMSAMGGGGMSFYGELPDSYTLAVNANHPLVQRINTELEEKLSKEIKKITDKIAPLTQTKSELDKANKDKKDEEIKQEDKDRIEELTKKITDLENKKTYLLRDYGTENAFVKQLIDLALLANGMLKGEELTKFVKRSIELM
jgi:molecular chaperone HtpG